MIQMTTKQIKELIELANESAHDIVDLKKRKKKLKQIGLARLTLRAIQRDEDWYTFIENLEARPFYSANGIKNLYKAICHQSVHDYKWALRTSCNNKADRKTREEAETMKGELEKFFDEDFFKNVSGCHNKEKTIKNIISMMRKEAGKKIVL